jgi:SAM-dependent methyltransferase
MRNEEQWKPGKFDLHQGRLRGSRDPKLLSIASRVVADATAAFYHDALPRYAQGALVDLGCGRVPLYAAYKDHVSSITCVDWANTLHPNPHLDLEQDLNGPIELPDASFDTVILSDVLEHIRKPEILVAEMHRLLRPGGHVLLNVPFYHGLHERPHDYFRYTEYALRSMAEDAGFEVLHMETTGGAPEILADVLSKTMLTVPLIGRFKARSVQAFTGWFVRSGWGRKVSKRTGTDFPLGYAVVLRKR